MTNEPPGSGQTDPYAALRHGPYRQFLFGRAIALVGGQMQTAAVGWAVYERMGSMLALGFIGLVQIVPVLLLFLPAGHAADRYSRRTILLLGQGLTLACSLALAALFYGKGPPLLVFAFLFLLGVARAFTAPALTALLPNLIPRNLWGNAATWNSSLFELTGITGPALAGLVIAATSGATAVFLAAAVCTAVAMVLFALISVPPHVAAPRRAVTWVEMIGGLRFVARTRLLLAAQCLDLFAVFFGGATALLPVVARDILQVGPVGFGWLRAAPSLGAIAMALYTAHRPPWRHAGRILTLAFVGFGLATIVFGFSRRFVLSIVMLVLTGAFDNLNVVIRQTLVQFITPDEMRGRVSSVNFIFIGCSNELGAFESGVAAYWLGPVAAIAGGGAMTLLVVLVIMRGVPELRRLARIFHSSRHRYDHLSARVTSASGGRRICGLYAKPPLGRELMRPPTPEKPQLAQASRRILPDLLTEVSGGGFAGSPDVPASKLGSRVGYSLQAGHRLECETSGLGRLQEIQPARA
jgi:MFS family permease